LEPLAAYEVPVSAHAASKRTLASGERKGDLIEVPLHCDLYACHASRQVASLTCNRQEPTRPGLEDTFGAPQSLDLITRGSRRQSAGLLARSPNRHPITCHRLVVDDMQAYRVAGASVDLGVSVAEKAEDHRAGESAGAAT
jgi:hypothetical protein